MSPATARCRSVSDQEIGVHVVNFDAEVVTFFSRGNRRGGSAPVEEAGDAQAMEPAKAKSDYQFFIFNLQTPTEYFVEANGLLSETFKLDVATCRSSKQ